MNALVDTNILVRLSDTSSPLHPVCNQAVPRLLQRGDVLSICSQVAIEYWSVATRPRAANGLEFDPAGADTELRDFERWFQWLPEPPDIGARWRRIVIRHGVIGRQAHDARLVAFMEAHGLTHLLTLDTADFARYTNLTVLHPANVK